MNIPTIDENSPTEVLEFLVELGEASEKLLKLKEEKAQKKQIDLFLSKTVTSMSLTSITLREDGQETTEWYLVRGPNGFVIGPHPIAYARYNPVFDFGEDGSEPDDTLWLLWKDWRPDHSTHPDICEVPLSLKEYAISRMYPSHRDPISLVGRTR